MKKEVVDKIAHEISDLHKLDEEKAVAITYNIVKLIKQNGYGIVSTAPYNKEWR